MKYQILQCSSAASLEDRVNQLLKQGWICQGGYSNYFSSTFFGPAGVTHCQAMVSTADVNESNYTPSTSYSAGSGLVSVVLVSLDHPHKKIQAIKEVRMLVPGLGLAEAKTLVENAPRRVKEGISRQEAESIKMQLESAGCQVRIE